MKVQLPIPSQVSVHDAAPQTGHNCLDLCVQVCGCPCPYLRFVFFLICFLTRQKLLFEFLKSHSYDDSDNLESALTDMFE